VKRLAAILRLDPAAASARAAFAETLAGSVRTETADFLSVRDEIWG